MEIYRRKLKKLHKKKKCNKDVTRLVKLIRIVCDNQNWKYAHKIILTIVKKLIEEILKKFISILEANIYHQIDLLVCLDLCHRHLDLFWIIILIIIFEKFSMID